MVVACGMVKRVAARTGCGAVQCARCGRDVRKVVGVRRRVAQGRGAVGGCGQQGVAARMGCGAGRRGWWWLGRGRNGASRALRREVGRELPDADG